jgi:hypothetical protein
MKPPASLLIPKPLNIRNHHLACPCYGCAKNGDDGDDDAHRRASESRRTRQYSPRTGRRGGGRHDGRRDGRHDASDANGASGSTTGARRASGATPSARRGASGATPSALRGASACRGRRRTRGRRRRRAESASATCGACPLRRCAVGSTSAQHAIQTRIDPTEGETGARTDPRTRPPTAPAMAPSTPCLPILWPAMPPAMAPSAALPRPRWPSPPKPRWPSPSPGAPSPGSTYERVAPLGSTRVPWQTGQVAPSNMPVPAQRPQPGPEAAVRCWGCGA